MNVVGKPPPRSSEKAKRETKAAKCDVNGVLLIPACENAHLDCWSHFAKGFDDVIDVISWTSAPSQENQLTNNNVTSVYINLTDESYCYIELT